MRDVERVIKLATGMDRVYRRHGLSHVDFMIGDLDKFDAAAVALKLQYQTDPVLEQILQDRK